jgi:hypothetical protein
VTCVVAKAERDGVLREPFRQLCRPALLVVRSLHAITSGDHLVTSTGYENGITSNSDFAE